MSDFDDGNSLQKENVGIGHSITQCLYTVFVVYFVTEGQGFLC